jgi:hypothetical protein
MQRFDDSDLTWWLSQMEHYFQLQNIIDHGIKVRIIVLYLDVERFRWSQWHMRAMGYLPLGWTHFCKAFCAHFDRESNFLGRLTKLKQTGLVKEFITTFE